MAEFAGRFTCAITIPKPRGTIRCALPKRILLHQASVTSLGNGATRAERRSAGSIQKSANERGKIEEESPNVVRRLELRVRG